MCAMAEVLPAGVPASVLVELPARAEGLGPDLGPASAVKVRWLERGDDEPGGAERLVAAASEITLPSSGTGHAYVAGEMKVVRAVTAALQARGLAREQISPKAYWRLDSANAPHGEPLDPDRLTGPTRPL
jgi:NADPH-dependent ferric siderophore reductase